MLEEIDVLVIDKNFQKILTGVKKYIIIMNNFHRCDVSQDREFQKTFNGFYRIGRKRAEFYKIYYEYMEQHKRDDLSFEDVITYIYRKTNGIEASFSSKLLATINPNMPIWDRNVLSQLSIIRPILGQKDKIRQLNNTIETYSKLEIWYTNYLKTKNAREVISQFDVMIPNAQMTNVKK